MTDNTRTNTRRPWWLVAAVVGALLASLLFLACSSDKKDGGSTPSATNASPSATDATSPASTTPTASGDIITQEDVLKKDPGVTKHGELKWGAMFEESGPLAGFGQPSLDGLKIAVKEINDAGGFQVGDTIYTINLIEKDTHSDVSQSLAIATELVRDDKVKVIWGPASVGDPESTVITQQNKVLHVCPCPRRELTSLTSADDAKGKSHWAFQTIAAPSKFLPPGAKNTKRDHPDYKTFATICVNSQTGHAFCKYFDDAYKAAGFEQTGEVFFPDGTNDFSPFLTTLKPKNPDIILNFTDAGVDQLQLLKNSWQLDLGKFYISVALPYDLFEALVGTGIRDKIVAAGAAPRNNAIYTSENARIFFEEKYKPVAANNTLPPAAFAALLTYDPAYMLVAAMQKAGTVDDTTKIADALETIHYAGYGEDDMYFNSQNIIVTGNDACNIYQSQMTCSHFPPAPQ